jgi:hypothetical protein
MPLPKPRKGEQQSEFISRCMGDAVMNKEYPDNKQRAGVCHTQWRRKETAKFKCKDCEHLTNNEDSDDLVCPECGGELEEMARKGRAKNDIESQPGWSRDSTGLCFDGSKFLKDIGEEPLPKNFKLSVKELKDVEIFEAGIWKGKEYTIADIDEMIKNQKDGVVEPYLNLNHSKTQTEEGKRALKTSAMGWVKKLKRVGKKLLADFKQVPKLMAELIQAGSWKKRSIEVYRRGYEHANGKIYNNVLEAVTFHGGDGVPAVNTLADIANFYKLDMIKLQADQNGEKDLIDFQNDNWEELKVGEIKIDQAEYDRLKSNQRTEKDNDEIAKLKADKAEADKKAEDAEAKAAEAEKEKEAAEKKVADSEEAALKSEAEGFVDKIITDNKLLPKYKDMKVAEYMRLKKEDGETLKLFKEQMETSDKIMNFGAITAGDGAGSVKFKSEISDIKGDPTARAEEIIQAIMKKDGCTRKEAEDKSGIPGYGGEEDE